MMAMMPSAALLIAVAALVSSALSGVVVSSAVAAAPLADAVRGGDRRRDDGSNKHVIVVVGGGGGTARRPSDPPPTRTRTSAATNGVVDLRRFSVGKKLPAAGPVPAVADHDRRGDDASHRGQSVVAGVGGSHSDPAAASEPGLTEQPPFPASLSAGLSVIRPVNPAINSADCPEMTARHPPAGATAACEELLFFRWFELWGGPCPVGQWLVLDPETLAPRCRRPECPLAAGQLPFHDRHPALPEKDSSSSPIRCVLASSPPADVCPPGQWLVADEFGRGRCECRDGHLHWPGDGACYTAFTRGPCPDERSLLVWDDVGNEVTCRWNPCPDGQIYWLSRGDCYPWPAPTAADATRQDDEVAAATRPQSNESSSPPSTTNPCPPGRRLAVERPDCLSSDEPSCIGKPSYPPVRLVCADDDDDERAAVFVASVEADHRPSHPAAGSTATEDDGKDDGINASPTMPRLIFPRRRRRRRAVVSDDDNGDDFDARYVSSKSTLWRADDRLALLADGGDDEERGRDGDGRHGEEEERRYSVAADDNRAGGGDDDDDDDGGEEQEGYVMPGRVPFRKWVCGPGTVKDFLGHCRRRRVPEPAAADPTADSGRPTLVSTLASPTFAKKRQAANR